MSSHPTDSAPARESILVSIVIPMLNEERHISACLDSILAQTFDAARREILVIDGGSTDRSLEIVRGYAERHPSIQLLHNPERLQACALNIGVRHSRGTFILQMDAHSSYQADYVAQTIRTFEETGAYNIAGLFVSQPGGTTRMARAIWLVQGSRFGSGASYGRQPGKARFVGRQEHVTSGWSFRREAFERVGLFDRRPLGNHDVDMSVRIHEAGMGVYFQPAIVAHYFARSTARAFANVMWRNGHYLAPMWMIRPASFARVHAIPALSLFLLIVGLLGGLFWHPLMWAEAAAIGLYALLDLAISIAWAAREGWWLMLYLPWLFPLTHFAYGMGTLIGIIRFGLRGVPPNPEADERVQPRGSSPLATQTPTD